MPAVERAGGLDALRDAAGAICRDTLIAAGRLAAMSVEGLDPGSGLPRDLLALRRVRAELTFGLDVIEQQVILFFWKKDLAPVQAMRLRFTFALAPFDPDVEPPPALTGGAGRFLAAPACLVPSPSRELLKAIGPPGASERDCLVLRVGPGRSRWMCVSSPGGPSPAVAVTALATTVLDRWVVGPFADAAEVLRAFAEGEDTEVTTVALPPARSGSPPRAHTVIETIVKAYLEVERTAAAAPELPEPLAMLVSPFAPSDAVATARLRVNDRGELAPGGGALTVDLRVDLAVELAGVVARVTLLPPDFVLAGPRKEALVAALRDDIAPSILERTALLGEGEWARWLDAAAPRLAAFRLETDGEEDVHLVLIPGRARAGGRLIVLRVHARAAAAGVTLEHQELLHGAADTPDPTVFDRRTADTFLRVFELVRRWLALGGHE